MSAYRAVVLTRKGGPEVLVTQELPLPEPGPGELRVRVRATGVGATDVTMRRGSYPFAPRIPFVPGYESVGTVDALGPGVTEFHIGERVGALLVYGGYATHVVRSARDWVRVPNGLDDAEAAALILNYVTAFQMIHREARMQPGQRALVNAANGGVGQALLDLLRAHGVSVVGAAARSKFAVVQSYGATPIEGRTAALDAGVARIYPKGVDASFDGVGGAHTAQCIRATRRGGIIVWYGFVGTRGLPQVMGSAARIFFAAPLSGRRGRLYGITGLYRRDPRPFHQDLPKLFAMLAEKKIHPRIAERLPLLEARRANERLEAGGIDGKIVLVAGIGEKSPGEP
jgi:NADPH:quinone reductase-like Zn-dependent oxidoreductase